MINAITKFHDCNSTDVQELLRFADEFYSSLEYGKAIEMYSEALKKPFNRQAITCEILMKRSSCYEKIHQLDVNNKKKNSPNKKKN